MPIYEYICEDCQTHFEKIVLNKTQEIACPKCAGKKNAIQLSVFSAANGAGNGASARSSGGFRVVAAVAVARLRLQLNTRSQDSSHDARLFLSPALCQRSCGAAGYTRACRALRDERSIGQGRSGDSSPRWESGWHAGHAAAAAVGLVGAADVLGDRFQRREVSGRGVLNLPGYTKAAARGIS